MTQWVAGYFKLLKIIIAALLAGMVVLVFGNVVLRYAFGSGITVSDELARWFFVWLVFLGSIIGLKEHAHLGVDTLLKALPPPGRRICFLISHGLMVYASILLIQGSWAQTLINWNVRAPATGISVGWFYGIGLVFGVSAVAILTYEIARVLTGRAADDELIVVRESEEH